MELSPFLDTEGYFVARVGEGRCRFGVGGRVGGFVIPCVICVISRPAFPHCVGNHIKYNFNEWCVETGE